MIRRDSAWQSFNRGFSLIESLLAIAILGGAILFLVQLMTVSMQLNYISADETRLQALVNDRLEQLTNMDFDVLGKPCINTSTSCGSLTSDITDTSVTPNILYFDDSISAYKVRWTIATVDASSNPLPALTKRITVEAISDKQQIIGLKRKLKVYYDKVKY